MQINRRRAPSTQISREKKLGGHARETLYAELIGGSTIRGTKKGDVQDKHGNLHSVKSGRKWQVFLYGHNRISSSQHLSILQRCLDAFPIDAAKYFEDRIQCIARKEAHIKQHGRAKELRLTNEAVEAALKSNEYIRSKQQLAVATRSVCEALHEKTYLRQFLGEALFNNTEVSFLAVKDSTYKKDEQFKVFLRDDVLDILTSRLFPTLSKAGHVPEDYNVPGQKTLLCYKTNSGATKNIVEIEIRNDSHVHYRQVRFNMYSKDTLSILLTNSPRLPSSQLCDGVMVYGEAIPHL
jgi:hypothetical protein